MSDSKKIAQDAGFYVREGEYTGTTDNRLGRWYIGHASSDLFTPFGAGYASAEDAWQAAAQRASESE